MSQIPLGGWIADLEKFKKAGITGLALAGKGDWAIAHLLDWMLLASMGPDKFEGLYNGSTSWTGPEVAAGIKNFQRALSYGNKGAGNLDWPDAGKFLPSGLITAMLSLDISAPELGFDTTGYLPALTATLVLLGYGAVFAFVAIATSLRRDID